MELRDRATPPVVSRTEVPRIGMETGARPFPTGRASHRPRLGSRTTSPPRPALLPGGPGDCPDRGDPSVPPIGRCRGPRRGGRTGARGGQRGDRVAGPTGHVGAHCLPASSTRGSPSPGRRGVSPRRSPTQPRAVPVPRPPDPASVGHAPHSLPDPLWAPGDPAHVSAPGPGRRAFRARRPLGPLPDEPGHGRPSRPAAGPRCAGVHFRTSIGPGGRPTPHSAWRARSGPARGPRGNRPRGHRLRADEDVTPHRPAPRARGPGRGLGQPRLRAGLEDGRSARGLAGPPLDGRFPTRLPGLSSTDPLPRHGARVPLSSMPTTVPPRGGPTNPTAVPDPPRGVPSDPVGAAAPGPSRS
jgi:hypothetical protein